MKRILITLVLAVALSMMFAGAAYANFGPHGGYEADTDQCAACHRAHTSFSEIGWLDAGGTEHESALLVTDATTMTEFCNACHGAIAVGAATNVEDGIFDSGPSASITQTAGTASDANTYTDGGVVVDPMLYETDSIFNAPLNGGGFSQMPDVYTWEESATIAYTQSSSAHSMDAQNPLWGAGSAVPYWPNLTCTNCHDPHGSSNYRILKGSVNDNVVGGYAADGETPNGFVVSNEVEFPADGNPLYTGVWAGNGFRKHDDGAAQMAAYRPNYTDTAYMVTNAGDPSARSMSVWCAACHERYNVKSDVTIGSTYDYDNDADGGTPNYEEGLVGARARHRHAVDINLAAGWGPGRALAEEVTQSAYLPLELDYTSTGEFWEDYIGCLTCHRAHGASVDMTGWAAATLTTNATGTIIPVPDGIPGVNPDKDENNDGTVDGSTALLRVDNRGVCERCHNK